VCAWKEYSLCIYFLICIIWTFIFNLITCIAFLNCDKNVPNSKLAVINRLLNMTFILGNIFDEYLSNCLGIEYLNYSYYGNLLSQSHVWPK